jgi:hypothetical protein
MHDDHSIVAPSSPSDHPLKRFTLWSNHLELSCNIVDTLLAYTPNVERMYLQTQCRLPFVRLADSLAHHLRCLSRFDCFVKELTDSDARIGNLHTLHNLHSCFNRIQCILENSDFRIFATN